MCETGRVAADHTQSGAAVAARNQLLDSPVVEPTTRRTPVLHEDFGEVAAVPECMVECALKKLRIDHLAYRKPMPLTPGLSASATLVVEDADTAEAIGSGDVPVLATPRVVALAEQASVEAVVDDLDGGTTTVGYEVQLTHIAPTAVGGKVVAEATLENVEGRRLTFRVSVNDSRGLVAAGRITRVVVVRDRFIDRARAEG